MAFAARVGLAIGLGGFCSCVVTVRAGLKKGKAAGQTTSTAGSTTFVKASHPSQR